MQTSVGPAAVVRQQWNDISARVEPWEAVQSVSVVIPAQDCQEQLDLTLAALSEQTYPRSLLELVIVDDGSRVPLAVSLPGELRSTLVRLDRAEGHGSGRARHEGARVASNEILLFLDADMITARDHVEMHVRRHDLVADALVLGHKLFVDCAGIQADQVARAVRSDSLEELFSGRQTKRHVWQEEFVEATSDMTEFREDLFISVVGASVSIGRHLYEEAGGFSAFGLRGVVDTEFGYRAFTAGAVPILERSARSFHQGLRSFASKGDEIKQERLGLAANYLPINMFRLSSKGRSWKVPRIAAVVPVGDGGMASLVLTVDCLLATSVTDLVVYVEVGPETAIPSWVRDYFSADGRVSFVTGPMVSGFPSPYSLVVPHGAAVGVDTVAELLAELEARNLGAVFSTVPGVEGAVLEFWATRALLRSRRHTNADSALEEVAERLFGTVWLAGSRLGVRDVVVETSRQGMLRQADL